MLPRRLVVGFALAGAAIASAQAADGQARSRPEGIGGLRPASESGRRPASEGAGPASEIDTEDLFGFTVGSDVGEVGERVFRLESEVRAGKRGGRYRVWSPRLEAQSTPSEDLTFILGSTFDRFAIRNVPGLEDRHTGGLGDLSAEIRYRLLRRGSSPIGLTLSAAPRFGLFDRDTGERAGRVGLEARLSADAELVPERVFGAVNLTYEPERIRPRSLVGPDGQPTPTERETTLGASAALAVRAAPNLFLGAEARYLRRYEGLDLRSLEGQALFFGPTFSAALTDRVSVTAAWSAQVAGRARDGNRSLDLDDFERHQARVQLKIRF